LHQTSKLSFYDVACLKEGFVFYNPVLTGFPLKVAGPGESAESGLRACVAG